MKVDGLLNGEASTKRGAGRRQPVSAEDLLGFLMDRHSYPERPCRVELIQTHASYVFMAAPFVYKVRKPVNLGFLDYSTLEKRRLFSHREVELNRRFGGTVHLGVVPISLVNGRLRIGVEGRVVEYAVKMRKLSDRYFMKALLRGRKIGGRELGRIVGRLKRFYESQVPEKRIAVWGRVDRLRVSTDENFRQTRGEMGHTLSVAAYGALRHYTNCFYASKRALLERRVREGWIRDCHGDLHLEHIHLAPRLLSIYDCIEFNDRLRYLDVANDIAFLAMDLDFNGRPDLSGKLVEGMARALEDPGMLGVMNFYKCYRAYVRGKVESLRSREEAVPMEERREAEGRAKRYFQLALSYAVAGSEPMVLAVMGRAGAGKSTLAQRLGQELGWTVHSSDRERKELAGVPLYKRGGAEARARLYSVVMSRRTYRRLLSKASSLAERGKNSIVDATFSCREDRQALRERLARTGARCCFVEVEASNATLRARLRGRDNSRREISDARLEDYDKLTEHYEPPTELNSKQLIRLRAEGESERMLRRFLKRMVELKVKTS